MCRPASCLDVSYIQYSGEDRLIYSAPFRLEFELNILTKNEKLSQKISSSRITNLDVVSSKTSHSAGGMLGDLIVWFEVVFERPLSSIGAHGLRTR